MRPGLHARPAAVLASRAKQFTADVRLRRRDDEVNARSVVGIMGLEIARGDRIEIVASGPDAGEAVRALSQLVLDGLGEDGSAPGRRRGAAPAGVARPARSDDPNVLAGVAASPGIAVGNVFQVRHEQLRVVEDANDAQARAAGARRGARAGQGGAGCASGEAPAGRGGRKGRHLRRAPRAARRSGSAGDCRRRAVARQERGIRLADRIHAPRGPAGEPEERAARRARERPARRRTARAAEADRRRGRSRSPTRPTRSWWPRSSRPPTRPR